MNPQACHPIIYVRGYAMTPAEIEDTVSDPYMGFNIGSSKVRQLWDGKIKKFFFESPLVRLMKEYGYDDVYEDGIDQVNDPMAESISVPYRSIVIYRYYEPSSKDLGIGEKPNMERFAQGLGELILRLRDRMYPNGKTASAADVGDGTPSAKKDFKVYLVAHSMGGLVCRAFLQNPKLGSADARGCVDKFFTYATPHNGIDMKGVGNTPDWLSLYGMNTFNRDEIARVLALKKSDRDPNGSVDVVTNFDADRIFNLVGTNPADYKVAGGLSSFGAGDASDGLVRIDNATTRRWDGKNLVSSPQAFVHRSHSGYFGIVNSEEGYQNLVRFLFGDVRADGYLEVDELTLPPDVEKLYEAEKQIRASYIFEVSVSVRGKQWQLHRRVASENSAIFRPFDDLFPKWSAKKGWQPDRTKSPLLFNVFLDMDQRADKTRASLAFGVDLTVRVPEYTVDGFLFLKNHFEGSYVYRELLLIEATPPAATDGKWKIEYRFGSNQNDASQVAEILPESSGDSLVFEIPIEQPKPPGIKARLRVKTAFWNR